MVSLAQLKRQAEDQSMKALQDRREQTRQDFFKGRQDVSNNRLDRRQIQKDLYENFKNTLDKAEGTTNLYQASEPIFDNNPSSPTFGQYVRTTLADKAMQLANKYGPTPREILGDMGYGLGSIAKGFAETGGPMISLFRGIGNKFKGGVKDAYDSLRNAFKGESQFTSQAPGGLYNNQPIEAFISPTFDDRKIQTESLPPILINEKLPSEMSNEQFRNTYPFLYDSRMENLPFKAVPNNVTDQTNFQKALANARVENTGVGLDSLKAAYEFARNPNLNTKYGNFSLDDLLTGEPTLGYETDLFGGKLGLSANPLQDQYNVNYSLAFNKGGSVNKHSGLGYMLK